MPSNESSAACARCGCPEADHPGFLAIGPCDEYRADHPAAQGQCAKCGATENLGVRCAHPDCPNRSAATKCDCFALSGGSYGAHDPACPNASAATVDWEELAQHFADELVERWHRPDSAHALPLAQFMGLTDAQYAAWVEGRWADVLA